MKWIQSVVMVFMAMGMFGCGNNSSNNPPINPNNGTVMAVTDGEFVGISTRKGSILYEANRWKMTIDYTAKTFTAQNLDANINLSGILNLNNQNIGTQLATIGEESNMLLLEVTTSNNNLYPVGRLLTAIGVKDKILFVDMSPLFSNTASFEFATFVKKDSCPSSDLDMIWHRIMSPVLANPWDQNDILADLKYTASSAELLSQDSWTSSGSSLVFKEASFLSNPAVVSCIGGEFSAVQTLQNINKNYKGYITTDGYMVSYNTGWNATELSLPKTQLDDINAMTGNYTGYLIINEGNSGGLQEKVSIVSSYIDFTVPGAESNIVVINGFLNDGLAGAYINIQVTASVNQPVDGEIGGNFRIFKTSNTNHPLIGSSAPLPDTLVDPTVNIDLTQSDYEGKITCSAYNNLENSNKNLIVCEAYAKNQNWPTPLDTPIDNLFTLILTTGKIVEFELSYLPST